MALKLATNTSAFLKMGVMGKQGAGKTKTAGKVAIGLVQYLKEKGIAYADKPVAFFDTETGSDYLIPDFEAASIPFMVEKAKTLKALLETMDTAERECSVLIIDSITHPYRELIAAYLKQKNRTFLQIDDWNYIKGDYGWAQFTRRYINSKLHIIMCGRAGDDLEQYVDENGKRQLEKVGTKMKTEAETGFEPSLLVLMELLERNERGQGVLRERIFVNRATVVKDRWDKINGNQFDDPGFAEFLPHISRLALGGEHVGVNDTGDSRPILHTEKRDWQPVQRKIVLGEIQDIMVLHIPGQTAAEKQRKIALINKHFNAGWVEVEEVMTLDKLRAGYDSLHVELEGKPSKYAITGAPVDDGKPIDSLPDHSAAPLQAEAPAQPAQSIEELLGKQLGELTTSSEVLHFGMEIGKRTDLDTKARLRMSHALSTRLAEIATAPKPEPELTEAETKPKRERKPAKAAVAEPEREPEAVQAQTYIDGHNYVLQA
jgi:hypothetical protein